MAAPILAYLVHASADESNDRFPAGQRHAMVAFVRQDEAEPNLLLCESIVRNAGWTKVEIRGTTLATPESLKTMQKSEDPAVDAAYRHAVRHGFRLLVFAVPIPTVQ